MPSYDLDDLLEECRCQHGHLCPGQLLGVRMALLGCHAVGIKDPRGADRKKLIIWVEIDRCMADAVSAVTGARLGKRSLKFKDYGKVAASFLNLETGEALRVAALDEARQLADLRYPEIESKKERQWRAYKEAADTELFQTRRVKITCAENDLPGRPRRRVSCENCGEGVNDGREVVDDKGRISCRPCAEETYFSVL
jgi:formylmethanofuran dehydrogenase subunit E